MGRSGRRALGAGAIGALVALTIVGVLALVGAFDGGGGEGGTASRALPSVPLAGAQEEGNRIFEIYRRAAPATLFIQADAAGQGQSPFGPSPGGGASTGTGFLIDERGSVVTNAHVVEGASRVAIRLAENRLVPARLVGADISSDLALLEVDPEAIDAQPLPLGSTAEAQVGDPVVAIGNPFGLERTVTSGIVSAKQRRITAPNGFAIEGAIQTDAAVNPGNSGGPLIDAEGRVIGVNSQIAAGAGESSFAGIAFAIPAETVRRIVPDLRDDGRVTRPYLGVQTVELTPDLARQLGVGVEQGALVVGVEEGSPADRAGLRAAVDPATGAIGAAGDVIVRIDGRAVGDTADVSAALDRLRPGDRTRLDVVRGGERRQVTAILSRRPE